MAPDPADARRRPPERRSASSRDCASRGSRREVLATFIVDINAMVFGSPRSLFPALALDVFKVGPAGVGFMAVGGRRSGRCIGGAVQRAGRRPFAGRVARS